MVNAPGNICRKGIFLFCTLFLGACSTTPASYIDPTALEQSGVDLHVIQGVPLIQQEKRFCGPAALAAVLQYHKKDLSQAQAAEMVFTPGRGGTFQHDMITATRRNGFLALTIKTENRIVEYVTADYPVIVLQNLGLTWAPRWHYSVVIGYDLSRGGFYLNSGKKKLKFMPFKTFHNTWERGGYWAYIAVPPDRLPQLASQDQLFVETAHLERAGQFDPAATSYRNILKRDPDNPQVWFGLGNAWMASHNYAEAEKAYREAIRHTPDKLYLYNNLAHALSQQGKTPTACNLLEDRLHFSSKRLDSRPNKAYWGQLADTYQTLCKKS